MSAISRSLYFAHFSPQPACLRSPGKRRDMLLFVARIRSLLLLLDSQSLTEQSTGALPSTDNTCIKFNSNLLSPRHARAK